MASFITSALFLITIFSLQSNFIFAKPEVNMETSNYNLFAGDLLSAIVDHESSKNIVYSPVSIHAILSLIYMGAGGSTENELRSVLKLDQNQDKNIFALNYRNFLETTLNKTVSENENYAPPQLSLANRIYVSKNIKILEKFNKTAIDNFKSGMENVDFNNPLSAVQKINHWVEQKTSNKIKNLLNPDAVNEQTSMVLVNAIHLQAKWLTSFYNYSRKLDFHVNRNEIVKVEAMLSIGYYPYAALPELNAKAVQVKLQDSDISMLIILPNEIDGLKQVEEKLKGKDLNKIVSNMKNKYLDLYLPKFRIEYEIDLKESLRKMGCFSMFGSNANLTGIYDSETPQAVSKVVHKVFLDCNEKGLEAAAATYAQMIFRSGGGRVTLFRVDHPFFFAIRNKNAVFFAGHVKKI